MSKLLTNLHIYTIYSLKPLMLVKRYGLTSVTLAQFSFCVWHEEFICKLRFKAAGVSGDIPRWFQCYLSGHQQRVVLPGSFSEALYHKALCLILLCFYCLLMAMLKYWIQYEFYLLMILVSSSKLIILQYLLFVLILILKRSLVGLLSGKLLLILPIMNLSLFLQNQ